MSLSSIWSKTTAAREWRRRPWSRSSAASRSLGRRRPWSRSSSGAGVDSSNEYTQHGGRIRRGWVWMTRRWHAGVTVDGKKGEPD